ncbi:MAG: SIS domain-containing protein [Candidatus Heimdallarchaeota archaeon]
MNEKENDTNRDNLGKLTENEIFEIPVVLNRATQQKELISKVAKELINRKIHQIYLIGAGSSYHAGFAMSYMFNRITKIPTFTEFSMEFQYLIEPILKGYDCVIALSQSGETKDTIDSIILAKQKGCLTIAITNNSESSLAKNCDFFIELKCDEEKSVLATKTYVSELAVLAMLSLEISKENKSISNEEYNKIWVELIRIPDRIYSVLPQIHEKVKKFAFHFKATKYCFILGSGPEYATAMEAALKLKEGARIFGQAYSTAEFPHGPITLADSETCILAIIPYEDDRRKIKLLDLLNRIKQKQSTILGVYELVEQDKLPEPVDYGIEVPNTLKDLQPLIMILAIQLLTLEISRINNINCDTPKFLSKVSEI